MKEKFEISGMQFTSKEFGQLKCLMKALGNLHRDVIAWMLDPINWWHFCQQVRTELGIRWVPDRPEVGFLLQYQGVALRVMHARLCNSIAGADFITKLEKRWFEEKKELLVVYAVGNPEKLAKIAAAKTLAEMELLFNEMEDEDTLKFA